MSSLYISSLFWQHFTAFLEQILHLILLPQIRVRHCSSKKKRFFLFCLSFSLHEQDTRKHSLFFCLKYRESAPGWNVTTFSALIIKLVTSMNCNCRESENGYYIWFWYTALAVEKPRSNVLNSIIKNAA